MAVGGRLSWGGGDIFHLGLADLAKNQYWQIMPTGVSNVKCKSVLIQNLKVITRHGSGVPLDVLYEWWFFAQDG